MIHFTFCHTLEFYYCPIKEENHSGVPESEYKLLADKLDLITLTVKDPKNASPCCLNHVVPILWELLKFNAMMQQLMEKKSSKNTRAAMGSGMEHLIGSKAANTTAAMKDVDMKNDPDGDVSNMKVCDRS